MRLVLLVGVLLCSVACSPRATQLLVVVDTDMQVPDELARVEVSVFGDAGDPLLMTFGDDEPLTFPFSFGIAPRSGAADVRVEVRGLAPDATVLVQRAAATQFAMGRSVLLPMPLSRACVPASRCEAAHETCDAGVCVSAVLDSSSLADVDPSSAPRLLTPTPAQDGGVAPADAGADAMSACVTGAPCDPGGPCDLGEMRCAPDTCVRVGMRPVGALCGDDGRVCDAEGRCGAIR